MPNVDALSYIVWIATVLAYGGLAIAILYRRALKRWPWLFYFASISSVIAASLLAIYYLRCTPSAVRHMPRKGAFLWAEVYFWGYWSERFALGACHFGIIWNVGSALLSANRRWRRKVIQAMLGMTILALFVSASATLATPRPLYADVTAVGQLSDRWLSLAGCILFVITAFSLDGIGMRWRRETLFVGLGLALQGALFTTFAWYVGLRALSPEEMAIPSLIRDIFELISIAFWISAFVPLPKPDSYSAISADRLQSTLESLKSVVADV